MAQQVGFNVYDGAATPIVHAMVADGISRDKDGTIRASYKESLASLPESASLRIHLTKRKLPSGINRVSVRVEVPVMEAINAQNSSGYTAASKVAFVDTVEVVGYFHERSTPNNKALANQIALNFAAGVTTSVARPAAGQATDLLDRLIFPS